jgi:hypothetical protein
MDISGRKSGFGLLFVRFHHIKQGLTKTVSRSGMESGDRLTEGTFGIFDDLEVSTPALRFHEWKATPLMTHRMIFTSLE